MTKQELIEKWEKRKHELVDYRVATGKTYVVAKAINEINQFIADLENMED